MDGRTHGAPLLIMPEELEFLAADQKITIIPNFKFEPDDLRVQPIFQDSFGRLRPNVQAEVPIWLALALFKRNRCRICVPEWMDKAALKLVFESEKTDSQGFQPIPYYYIEISRLLLNDAKDAFGEDYYEVKDLVESIRQARLHKIQAGLGQISASVTVKLNNLAAGECNLMRGFMAQALDMFHRLSQGPSPSLTQEDPNASLEI